MARRVEFDFEGSLQLCRQLTSLADSLESDAGDRDSDTETALAQWLGPFAERFADRREDEQGIEVQAVGSMRGEAEVWANAWADALHQQNLYNRGEYVDQLAQEKSDDRAWYRKGSDAIGFTENNSLEDANNEVPIPERPPTPTAASNFTATATEKTYP